jgi:hypothetical protein
MVETAAVDSPQLTTDALAFEVFILRRRQAAVQKDKVKRRAHPGNGGNDMNPSQQQIGPIKKVAFHV